MIARYHQCAGGVLYNPADKKVALIHFLDDGLYRLPKGHIKKGETPAQAAQREVTEETGYTNIERITELGMVEFTYQHWKRNNETHHKTIHHFLFVLRGPEHNPQLRDANETHAVAWLSFNEAIQKIAYDNARELLVKAQGMVGKSNKGGGGELVPLTPI